MTYSEVRLDRQLMIEGWKQEALDKANIGVIGGHNLSASLYTLSASALGINNIKILAPSLDERLMETARNVNKYSNITHLKGYYTSDFMKKVFEDCDVVVDLSDYGLSTKLSIARAFENKKPVIRSFVNDTGVNIFTYMKDREWKKIESVIPENLFPIQQIFTDPLMEVIATGISVEETKNFLMEKKTSDELIKYNRYPQKKEIGKRSKALVVGAGALGNFVGLGLALSKSVQSTTFIDMDDIEEANLNRQVFLYDGVGKYKSDVLSHRMRKDFYMKSNSIPEPFDEKTDLTPYEVIFDCVDNFETRILLSERAKKEGKILISGGTNVYKGQMIAYKGLDTEKTPAEALGLYEIVKTRKEKEEPKSKASCVYRPNPSVIMTNQIIGGIMVDAWRKVKEYGKADDIYYDSLSPRRMN